MSCECNLFYICEMCRFSCEDILNGKTLKVKLPQIYKKNDEFIKKICGYAKKLPWVKTNYEVAE